MLDWEGLAAAQVRAAGMRFAPQARTPALPSGAPMDTSPDHATESADTQTAYQPMRLDEAAVAAARQSLDEGAVTPHDGPFRQDIIRMLNDSLATELVCVLRYKRHHFTAKGLASPRIAEEFMVHALSETGHADKLAQRIVQLGGTPDFDPESLRARSHAEYDDSSDLRDMIKANLVAERVAIEVYSQLIDLIGHKDSTTRRLLQTILADEQEHADELADWLTD